MTPYFPGELCECSNPCANQRGEPYGGRCQMGEVVVGCERPGCIGWGCPVCDPPKSEERVRELEAALRAIVELPTYDMFSGWGGGSMDRVENGDWIDSEAQELARAALRGDA